MREPASMACRAAVRAALSDLGPGDLVLVGCSGGADSLALAAALAWVAPRANLRAGAVCVDHGLQADSAQVAQQAAQHCRDVGLHPVHIERVTVPADSPHGPEAAAREARHTALDAVAERLGAAAVLLGHTADDQAEQVLLGLLRGSGLRSLAGMPPRRARVRRPFLAITRQQTETSCRELGLTWWTDPHNGDPAYARVRARHALADLSRDLGPGITAGLLRTAQAARRDADFLDALAHTAAADLGAPPWPVPRLLALDPAVRTRVWRATLLASGAPPTDLTADHIAECERLLTDWHGQRPLQLPGRVQVVRTAGVVDLVRTVN